MMTTEIPENKPSGPLLGLGLSEELGVADEAPPPQASAEERAAYYMRAYLKVSKQIGKLGGMHGHMSKVLDAADVPRIGPISLRVEMACLELRQARLQEQVLRLELKICS